jgi:2-dehydro-3-deoxygalactonokinase
MTAIPSGEWLAVDWGTSNLRAWRMGSDGAVRDVQRFPDLGVARLQAGEAAQVLDRRLRPSLGAQGLPALLCGMVGSAMGIALAPYADCPSGPQDLAASLLQADALTFIVPGLRCRRPDGQPDVMRGEETKILGWLKLNPSHERGTHVLCLPGTHGKWVRIVDGRIDTFMTCMTGELFALLGQHSVITPGAAPDDPDAFADGLRFGARDTPLASRLFAVRARMVGEGLAGASAAAFLSGLLIGDEAIRMPAALGLQAGDTMVLMVEPALMHLYRQALERVGLSVDLCDADAAVLAGLTSLWSEKTAP